MKVSPNPAMQPVHRVGERGTESRDEARRATFGQRPADAQDADRPHWRRDGEADDDAAQEEIHTRIATKAALRARIATRSACTTSTTMLTRARPRRRNASRNCTRGRVRQHAVHAEVAGHGLHGTKSVRLLDDDLTSHRRAPAPRRRLPAGEARDRKEAAGEARAHVVAIGGERGGDFEAPLVESDDADAELGSERNALLPELLNLLDERQVEGSVLT